MRRSLGLLLMVAGWSAAAWCGVVGLMFSSVYLMGYLGTRGNEAGSELVGMLGMTAAAVTVSLLVARLGSYLRKPRPTDV